VRYERVARSLTDLLLVKVLLVAWATAASCLIVVVSVSVVPVVGVRVKSAGSVLWEFVVSSIASLPVMVL